MDGPNLKKHHTPQRWTNTCCWGWRRHLQRLKSLTGVQQERTPGTTVWLNLKCWFPPWPDQAAKLHGGIKPWLTNPFGIWVLDPHSLAKQCNLPPEDEEGFSAGEQNQDGPMQFENTLFSQNRWFKNYSFCWGHENVLEFYRGGSCVSLWMYSMPLNCPL